MQDHPPLVPYEDITKEILNSYCLFDDQKEIDLSLINDNFEEEIAKHDERTQ